VISSMTLSNISVITPYLNQKRFAEQTLRSILNQDYPHLKSIIIDSNSKDRTVDIIKN